MKFYRQAAWDEPLLNAMGRKGRKGISMPKDQFPSSTLRIPDRLLRKEIPLPNLSQIEVVRHFTHLSQMNFSIDSGMYPLGSCTMKYNPKLASRIATDRKITGLHPYQDEQTIQGILEILYRLSFYLAEITGMSRVSLAPSAGAHAEFVGGLIIRKYLREIGEPAKDEILIPDSAHGTNPSSAVLAGFKVVKVRSDSEGLVDMDSLKSVTTKKTAGMMLTVPNTHGLFEKNIAEINSIVKEAGGLMYYDGANLNALLGKVRPADMGFDIAHLNLHKTFATPHGGGGPGAGPIGVVAKLEKYLPIPSIEKQRGDPSYFLKYDLPSSVGRIKGFYGNIGVLLRAYVYILMLGREGLSGVAEQSVLAANYLRKRISAPQYSSPFKNERPKHEFVLTLSNEDLTASDVAKSILDAGVHAPTTYFPLTVRESLMIEPTEAEPVENLDRYADVLEEIAEVSVRNPAQLKGSPRHTSIGRLDAVKANHPLTMRYKWTNVSDRKKDNG